MRIQRETSLEIFEKITENGYLSKLREEIYISIYENPGTTIKETCMRKRHIPETSVSPVFAQLERLGVIRIADSRACKITGNSAHEWYTTNNLPIKIEKPKKHKCKTCGTLVYDKAVQIKLF